MLGYLLYEAVEITFNVTKLVYNGATYTYYWWYGIENLTDEQKKINLLLKDDIDKDKLIEDLDNRIKILENKLSIENNNIKEID
jgi:hypothetical protein